MREQWARRLAYLTALLVALLSAAFAWQLNRSRPYAGSRSMDMPIAGSEAPLDGARRARIERGRLLFDEQGCSRCHAIGGQGNPAGALDGLVGAMDDELLREWIIAGPQVEQRLPRGALARKRQYRALPVEDIDALIELLKHPHAIQ